MTVSGSNLRYKVENFPAADGPISCQNRRRLLSWEKGRFGVQIVTFARPKNAPNISEVATADCLPTTNVRGFESSPKIKGNDKIRFKDVIS